MQMSALFRFLILAILLSFSCGSLGEELRIEQIAPGVYVHQGVHQLPNPVNRGEIANIGFIVGKRCVAVIDTGGNPEQGRSLKSAVERTTPLPICYVINTHMHPDHVYGNRIFKQAGTSFVGHYKLTEALAMRAPSYRDKALRDLGLSLAPEDFVPPDQIVRDRLDIDLGERTLTLTAHGTAHTDNDLSVFDPQTETLWLSDLLFIGHLPVIDGSLSGWIRELERLKAHSAKRVVPGHGPVASDWPAAAEAEETYLKTLQSEIRTAIKAGKTMEQAIETVGQSQRGAWQLFDDFHKRNVSAAFAELEWEEP
jgi:quinoprotein relay system zinc metallohydrolase 2